MKVSEALKRRTCLPQACRRPLVVRATIAEGVKMNIANDVTELIGRRGTPAAWVSSPLV